MTTTPTRHIGPQVSQQVNSLALPPTPAFKGVYWKADATGGGSNSLKFYGPGDGIGHPGQCFITDGVTWSDGAFTVQRDGVWQLNLGIFWVGAASNDLVEIHAHSSGDTWLDMFVTVSGGKRGGGGSSLCSLRAGTLLRPFVLAGHALPDRLADSNEGQYSGFWVRELATGGLQP